MIFVDTSFWGALASEKDPAHGRVAEVFRSFKERFGQEPLLTTNQLHHARGAGYPLVTARAIGTKQRERVRIGREWVEL